MIITDRLLKAINTAAYAHDGHRRKGGEIPYISHPYSVMLFASQVTDDEDVLIAALFHDILEDVPDRYNAERMKQEFGSKVLALVHDVSEKSNPEADTWQTRKDAYIAHLEEAPREAVIISLADKTHNISMTLEDYAQEGDSVWQRFHAPKEKQLWFYQSVAEVISRRLPDESLTEHYQALVEKLRHIVEG